MNNNDIFRRTRYILDLRDNQIAKIFTHVDVTATEQQVNFWLKREEDEGFKALSDELLIDFLDALIIEKRGPKKDATVPKVRPKLDNNLILMKLKIAFHLKAEEALAIMDLAGFKISKHEFSALFRKKDHKHYRACKNQMLRKFMKGLQIKYRGKNYSQQKTHLTDLQAETKKGKLSLKRKETKPQTPSKKTATKSLDKKPVKSIKAQSSDDKANSDTQTAASVWKIPKKPIR